MSSNNYVLLFFFVCLSFATQLYAQDVGTGLDTERFRPAMDSYGIVMTESGESEKKGDLSLGFYLHYANDPLVLRSGNEIVLHLVSDRLAGSLRGSFGITDWLCLGADVPVAFYEKGTLVDLNSGSNIKLSSAALGDIRIIPKTMLLRQARHGVHLAVLLPFTIPSGAEKSFYGSRTLSASPTVAISRTILNDRMALMLNLGLWLQQASGYSDLKTGNEFFYRLGLSYLFSTDWSVIGELTGGSKMSKIFKNSPSETPMEGLAGVRFFSPWDIIFTLGGSVGLLPGWGTPHFRAFAGVTWAPRDHDRDNDQILDKQDRCPSDPGPRENQGCPWGDADGDGIKDNLDKCPSDPGPIENGGCPWGDADGDGIKDNLDKCPSDPGPIENGGCPWGDADGDGIKDNLDKCPADPEDQDGFEDQDGCPDPDNDKDGIPDGEDKCPDQPETINGNQDEDGCPDEGKTVVIVRDEQIEILQKVHFASGKDTILQDSFGLLQQVVAVIRAHQEIKKIRVDGHTDDVGSDDTNMDLSERRSRSVMNYLIQRGIEPDRLQSMGFGETKPIDSNQTAAGRENNRRVEFIILKKE